VESLAQVSAAIPALRSAAMTVVIGLFISMGSADRSFSDEQCEYPSRLGSMLVAPENRLGEFRIVLTAPDYDDSSSVKRHLAFSTIWARLLGSELSAKTRGQCSAVIAPPSLYPDLRVFLSMNRSRGENISDSSLCQRTLQELLSKSDPKVETIKKTATDEANRKIYFISNPAGEMSEADNILLRSLTYIYEANSVRHALISVDAGVFQSLDPDVFLDWLRNQRAERDLLLTPLTMCQSEVPQRQIAPTGKLPYSNVAAPGSIKLSVGRNELARLLRRVVIVGDGYAVANSRISTSATDKYCNREYKFATDPLSGASVRVRCFKSVIHGEAWTLLFCDPRDCKDELIDEAVMAAIANDPDVVNHAKERAANGRPRGPYQVYLERPAQ